MSALALSPLELAGRLALVIGLAVFLGLAFEETYKSEQRSIPGGIRSFPMLAMVGALLFLIVPTHALAFVAGLPVLAVWLYAFVRASPVTPETVSMMIPGSNLLAYAIGPVALLQPPWVAVAVTVAAVLLLSARERLHRLIHVAPRAVRACCCCCSRCWASSPARSTSSAFEKRRAAGLSSCPMLGYLRSDCAQACFSNC